MAEDGIDDFALAKRKAARQLGAPETEALPAQRRGRSRAATPIARSTRPTSIPSCIAELRRIALDAMRAFERFSPYLTGPVLKGTAGPYAEIELQLFPESPKDVEIFLLDRRHPLLDARRRGASRATGRTR